VGLLRPKTLFPFPEKRLKELVANGTKRFVSVEMSNGQMRDDIRLAVDCAVPVDLVSRLGGNLLDLNQILSVL
jgi:2-oxoisovalerate ferredoxin oxidoreductase alpha subunit